MDGEITNTENRGERSTGESGTTGDGFILVEDGGNDLSGEDGLDLGADGGGTGASTNEFNGINLLEVRPESWRTWAMGMGIRSRTPAMRVSYSSPHHLRGSVDVVHD